MYALVQAGRIVKYPLSKAEIRAVLVNANTGMPSDLAKADLSKFGIVAVEEVAAPAASKPGVKVVEATPTVVDGKLVQTWAEIPFGEDDLRDAKDKVRRAIGGELSARIEDTLNKRGLSNLPDAALSRMSERARLILGRQDAADSPEVQADVRRLSARAKALLASVDAAKDADALAAIDVTTGWDATPSPTPAPTPTPTPTPAPAAANGKPGT